MILGKNLKSQEGFDSSAPATLQRNSTRGPSVQTITMRRCRKSPFYVLAGCALAVGIGAFVPLSAQAGAPQKHDDRLSKIVGYAKWTKVNKAPIYMAPSLAMRCAPTPPSYQSPNQHISAFFTTYVNKQASKAVDKPTDFPVGSVIVKEKRTAVLDPKTGKYVPDAKISLLTVMVKRESGFSSATGDWEFFAASGDGKKVLSQSTTHCVSCHTGQKSKGYVFMEYK